MESLFLVFFFGRGIADTAPAVNVAALHCAEYPVLEAVILALHIRQEVLGALSVGVTVRRTYGLHYGKLVLPCGSANLLFGSKGQGTYHRHLLVGQLGAGGKAADPPLGEQVHDEGLYSVIEVVAESDLVAAEFVCRVMESSAAHTGA